MLDAHANGPKASTATAKRTGGKQLTRTAAVADDEEEIKPKGKSKLAKAKAPPVEVQQKVGPKQAQLNRLVADMSEIPPYVMFLLCFFKFNLTCQIILLFIVLLRAYVVYNGVYSPPHIRVTRRQVQRAFKDDGYSDEDWHVNILGEVNIRKQELYHDLKFTALVVLHCRTGHGLLFRRLGTAPSALRLM